MDEQGWQPVRIAPIRSPHPCDGEDAMENWEAIIGQIVRVRPTPHRTSTCGSKAYEIHPDDLPSMTSVWVDVSAYVCEHQILAD